MRYLPRDYQQEAIRRFTLNPQQGLFIDPGGGKTSIMLSVVDNRCEFPVLVISTLRIAEIVWQEDADKWDHTQQLKVISITGTAKERLKALGSIGHIYTVNVENFPWLVQQLKGKNPFRHIILDESSLFKNPMAKRVKLLFKWLKSRPQTDKTHDKTNNQILRPGTNNTYDQVLRPAITLLTGTPTPRGVSDLYVNVKFLDGGERLGSTLTQFRDKFFTPGKRNGNIVYEWKPKPGAESEILSKISDICLSVRVSGIVDEPVFVERTIKLSEKSRSLYKTLEQQLVLSIGDKTAVAPSEAALINKLLQVANGFIYDDKGQPINLHNDKLLALEELVEEANSPIMVAYAFKHDKTRILQHFKGHNIRAYAGKKDAEDWNKGKIDLLLLHPAAAGHGLNLQFGGHHLAWFGLTWNLEHYIQTIRRLARPGQADQVYVHHIVAAKTREQQVAKALSNKNATQEQVLEALRIN